jgi:hypothetical protein
MSIMIKQLQWYLYLLLLVFITFGCHWGVRPIEELEDIPRISKEDLRDRLSDPEVDIIDLRYKPNWIKSDRKIIGAMRQEPMEVSSWIDRYPKDRFLVLYCD